MSITLITGTSSGIGLASPTPRRQRHKATPLCRVLTNRTTWSTRGRGCTRIPSNYWLFDVDHGVNASSGGPVA